MAKNWKAEAERAVRKAREYLAEGQIDAASAALGGARAMIRTSWPAKWAQELLGGDVAALKVEIDRQRKRVNPKSKALAALYRIRRGGAGTPLREARIKALGVRTANERTDIDPSKYDFSRGGFVGSGNDPHPRSQDYGVLEREYPDATFTEGRVFQRAHHKVMSERINEAMERVHGKGWFDRVYKMWESKEYKGNPSPGVGKHSTARKNPRKSSSDVIGPRGKLTAQELRLYWSLKTPAARQGYLNYLREEAMDDWRHDMHDREFAAGRMNPRAAVRTAPPASQWKVTEKLAGKPRTMKWWRYWLRRAPEAGDYVPGAAPGSQPLGWVVSWFPDARASSGLRSRLGWSTTLEGAVAIVQQHLAQTGGGYDWKRSR